MFAAAAILVLGSLIAGCGGSSTSSSSPNRAADATSHPSAQFRQKGSSTNNVVEFGHEAPPSERKTASLVLARNLTARENGNFAIQCETLARSVAEKLAVPKTGSAAIKACPKALERLAKPFRVSKSVRADTFDGNLGVLRIEGAKANALYHGTDNKDYAIEMAKENGKWLVGSITTTELNPPEKRSNNPAAEPNTKPG